MMTQVTLPTTRFSVDEFIRMVDADVFGTQRVELINGRIYRMAPQRNPHMACIYRINRAIMRHINADEWLPIQGTLKLDYRTSVDPDVMWIAAPVDTPEHLLPPPILVIEVSDTSYRKDSGVKLRKYAAAGIKDYWIANLAVQRIDIYREPTNATGRLKDWTYSSVTHHHRGDSISPLQRPNVVLPVDELLP